MRVLVMAAALIGVFVLPVSALAGGPRQNPYGSLFTAQLNQAPAFRPAPLPAPQFVPPIAAPSASTQTIMCGMTVAQGDARIDAALVHRLPANAPKPLITVIQPQICKR